MDIIIVDMRPLWGGLKVLECQRDTIKLNNLSNTHAFRVLRRTGKYGTKDFLRFLSIWDIEYYLLHDGFVFAGATFSTILLNELANFRFKMDESPTALIMRLEELLQDLEMLPGGASISFNDTQRIGYLLGALRHELEWATVTSTITSSQLRGEMTFRQACDELRFRCEAGRAYDIIDKYIKTRRKVSVMGAKGEEKSDEESGTTNVLLSSAAKRLNKGLQDDKRKFKCLAKDCSTKTAFSLCGLHYHSIVSGKTSSLELENNIGMAIYNVTTKLIEYPATVPKERLPQDRSKAGSLKQ